MKIRRELYTSRGCGVNGMSPPVLQVLERATGRMGGMKVGKKSDAVDSMAEAVSGLGSPAITEPEPDLEGAFAEDGVDLTLIRWMLRRTPTERLQAAQDLIDATWALRTDSET